MPAIHKKISAIHHRVERFSGSSGFGIVTYRRHGSHGPRWQSNYQLLILHRGSVELRVDGIAHLVTTGRGILLAPGHVEEFRFSREVEARHSWCQVLPQDLPAGMTFSASALHCAARCPPRTLALMRLGLKSAFRGERDVRAAVSLVIATMWSFVSSLDETQREKRGDGNSTALARFHSALENLDAGPRTLDSLARQAGVSRGHLIKIVRERLGRTPMELVWRERVKRAAKLLSETGLSLAEIADQTGFAHAYHLSRRFRQQFGRAPRQWRMGIWSGPGAESL